MASEELISLLTEIRDNQERALAKQEEHLAIAREQIERSRSQVEESIALQRQAIERVRKISRIAVPGIAFCLMMIAYLLIRYF
jgi:t-SNARE complex subunit (syntaxin)